MWLSVGNPLTQPPTFTGNIKIADTQYAPGEHALATMTAEAAIEFPRVVTVLLPPQTPFFKP